MNYENPDHDSNGKVYETHRVPYTNNQAEIKKWAKKAILDCTNASKSASKGFPVSSEFEVNRAFFLGHIEKMYSIYQGTYSHPELNYLTNEDDGNINMALPARLINYPLLKNNIDKIAGKFVASSIDLAVASVSPQSIDAKTKKRAELMFNKLLGKYVKEQEESTGVKLENSMPIVDDEDKYLTLSWKQIEELNLSKLLKISYTKHNWNTEFLKGILMHLILGFYAYDIVEINNDEIKIRVPKPQNLILDWSSEDDFGQDDMYFGEERDMTYAGILGYLKPTAEEIVEIKKEFEDQIRSAGSGGFTEGDIYNSKKGIRVIRMRWFAEEMVKAKVAINKYTGKEIVKYLKSGEDPKLSKKEIEAGTKIVNKSRGTWWTAHLVGKTVISPEKCQNMVITDNPSMPEGDFVACKYNRVFNQPNGMLAGVAPLQILWNEVMYKLELEIATSPGNVIEYDPTGKPDKMSYSKIFYYMKAKKLLITKKAGSARGIDLGLGSTQHLLNILMYIEQLAELMTGSNRFSKGDVSGETSPGVMNTAIAQADLLLEPYFLFHRESLRRLFRKAAAKLKIINQTPGDKQKYILGESGFEYFTVKPTIPTEDYDIYFVDGTIQEKKKQLLMALMDKMWSSGQATVEHALAVVKHDDINEIYAELGKLIQFAKKRDEAIQQQQAQIQQAEIATNQQVEQLKAQIEQMKKEYDKEIAQIYADAGIKKEIVVEDFKAKNPNQNK